MENSMSENHAETMDPYSIYQAVSAYLESIAQARSAKTADTYRYGMQMFLSVLHVHKLDPVETPITSLPDDAIIWFAAYLKDYAPATEQLYIQAVKGFYEYLAAENLTSPNLPRIRLLIRQRTRRTGQRLPQFPREAIEQVLEYAIKLSDKQSDDDNEHLRNLRDKAFLVTLADTGLRIHEACGLRRGDIDWNESQAVIIGKGNKQAVIHFSSRSLQYIREYLAARAAIDGATGRSLPSLPLFARHDKGAGKKTRHMSRIAGYQIVVERVAQALGPEAAGTITPHSFRHYFVTTVLRGSGNLKLAQELARHKNISVTQRYAHLSDDELDEGYYKIFENK